MLFSVEVDDKDVELIATSFCTTQGYQPILEDDEGNKTPNPDDPTEFSRKCVIKYIKSIVEMYQRQVAAEAVKPTDINIS